MAIFVVFFGFLVFLVLFVSLCSLGRCSKCFCEENVRTLLITAHPDDESMFFGPAILTLLQHKCPVILLCLSQGNYYGDGSVREKELYKAAHVLGIEHVHIINDSQLQDSPYHDWPVNRISDYIIKYVEQYNIQRIVSFDVGGVSGHVNHCSIHNSLREMTASLKDIEVYCLQSVNVLRKYASLLDTLLSTTERYHVISSVYQWWTSMEPDGVVQTDIHDGFKIYVNEYIYKN